MSDPAMLREAVGEFIEARRQMKSAWDSFHRSAFRQTFIHCHASLAHLVNAIILHAGSTPADEPMDQFFLAFGEHLPLDQAEAVQRLLAPPELKPLGPVRRDNIPDSVRDWMVTRKISRERAFAHLHEVQTVVSRITSLLETKDPGFFSHLP